MPLMIAVPLQQCNTASPSAPRPRLQEEDTFLPPPGDLLDPLLGSWALCGHIDDRDGYCWGTFDNNTADNDVNHHVGFQERAGFDDDLQDMNLQPRNSDNQSDTTCLPCAAPERATSLPDVSFQQSSGVLHEASSGFTFSPFLGTIQPSEPDVSWFSAGASFSFPTLPDISSDNIQWPQPRADRFMRYQTEVAGNADTLVLELMAPQQMVAPAEQQPAEATLEVKGCGSKNDSASPGLFSPDVRHGLIHDLSLSICLRVEAGLIRDSPGDFTLLRGEDEQHDNMGGLEGSEGLGLRTEGIRWPTPPSMIGSAAISSSTLPSRQPEVTKSRKCLPADPDPAAVDLIANDKASHRGTIAGLLKDPTDGRGQATDGTMYIGSSAEDGHGGGPLLGSTEVQGPLAMNMLDPGMGEGFKAGWKRRFSIAFPSSAVRQEPQRDPPQEAPQDHAPQLSLDAAKGGQAKRKPGRPKRKPV